MLHENQFIKQTNQLVQLDIQAVLNLYCVDCVDSNTILKTNKTGKTHFVCNSTMKGDCGYIALEENMFLPHPCCIILRAVALGLTQGGVNPPQRRSSRLIPGEGGRPPPAQQQQ